MPASMDLDKNRKLDWFFDQWVYDIGIPEYHFTYKVTGSSAKGYFVSGKILQSGVSNTFEMPVPLFAHYGNRTLHVGNVVVSGPETNFHFRLPDEKSKPNHITLNDNEAVLCTVKS